MNTHYREVSTLKFGMLSLDTDRQTADGLSLSLDVSSSLSAQDLCYRDVAWLNGDRLVLVAHEGIVTLVSPSDVLQEWNVGGANGSDAPGAFPADNPSPVGGMAGGDTASIGTNEPLSAGTARGTARMTELYLRWASAGNK